MISVLYLRVTFRVVGGLLLFVNKNVLLFICFNFVLFD